MTNTNIEYIRRATDLGLAVPNQIQLRPYTLDLIKISWSGSRPGLGTQTDGYTSLQNLASVSVRVRQVSKEDINLSGGRLSQQHLKVGPFVFPYDITTATGGIDPLIFSTPASTVSETYIRIKGPNYPATGNFFRKVWDDANNRNVCYYLYLENTGAIPKL